MTEPSTNHGIITDTLIQCLLSRKRSQSYLLLPVVRRELQRVLAEILISPSHRATYLEALKSSAWENNGYHHLSQHRPDVDIVSEQLLHSGVESLDDDQLLTLAADPVLLESLADLIDSQLATGELGPSWWDVLARIGATAYPSLGSTMIAVSQTNPKRNRVTRWIPWAITAASLLVAGGIWWGSRQPGGPKGELAATTSLARQGVLGADFAFTAKVTAPETGYVTVILLPPDGPPLAVFPGFGDTDIPVTKGTTAVVDNLPGKVGTRIVAIVTPTPATDTIRKATGSLRNAQNLTPEVVSRVVVSELLAARHPWVAIAPFVTTE